MPDIKRALLPVVFFVSLAAIGCGGPRYYGYRVPPPPPVRMYGPVGYAPGPGYVWTDG